MPIWIALLICGLFGVWVFSDYMDNSLVYVNCCGGRVCSDTWYDPELNLCHLTVCETWYSVGSSVCVYAGLNESLDNLTALSGGA